MAAVTFSLAQLGGDFGFTLRIPQAFGGFGGSVSSAGDIDNDGIDDLLIGAFGSVRSAFVVYGRDVVSFGSATLMPGIDTDLATAIPGTANTFNLGFSVSDAGDVNGDGIDDLIISSPAAQVDGQTNTGVSYVIYGKTGGLDLLDLSNLPSTSGFRIVGSQDNGAGGFSVSGAGDINGDGLADLVIGEPSNDGIADNAGAAFIVYGKSGTTRGEIDLASLSNADGFAVRGSSPYGSAGTSVSGAGDINNDGIDDFIVGVPGNGTGGDYAGAVYVIFGKSGATRPNLSLGSLSASDGFQIIGDNAYDYTGAVSSAGDVNGDGIDDLIVGAPGAGEAYPGTAYVIYGKTGATRANIDLTNLSAANGFAIVGEAGYDYTGFSVSSAGDVNGDGFDDIIVGAFQNDSAGQDSGSAYVVFGKSGTSRSTINLTTLSADDGFKLTGVGPFTQAGRSVSGAGDINDDGFDDIVVGAYRAPDGNVGPGEAYVIFGRASFVFGANNAPLANDDGITIDEDTVVSIAVLNNDSDPDGNAISVVGASNGANGTTTVNLDNTITYTPNADYFGQDTFSYTISDGRGGVDSATVTVTINPINDAPRVSGDFTGYLNEDEPQAFDTGAFDPDGDILTFTAKPGDGPSLGTISTSASGNLFYTPDANVFGEDIFTVIISDGNGAQVEQTISLTIYPVNDWPIVADDEIWVLGSGVFLVLPQTLLANDYDIEGDSFEIINAGGSQYLSAGYANGAVSINISEGFVGTTTFTYQVSDGAASEPATVTVHVIEAASDQPIDLANLTFEDGFAINGVASLDWTGSSVASIGDFNGDGIDDIAIGAPYSDISSNNSGRSFVIYGKDTDFRPDIDLASLTSANGFDIRGPASTSFPLQSGMVVASAGDFNNDGLDDLVVGDGSRGDKAYIVFGQQGANFSTLDLTKLTASTGIVISGFNASDRVGYVSTAGDFNGDGITDLIIGSAEESDPVDSDFRGAAYVVFGQDGNTRTAIDLQNLDPDDGFRIGHVPYEEVFGRSASSAGDINGDGYDDIVIGAHYANGDGFDTGKAYVIFGTADPIGSDFNVDEMSSAQGFQIIGSNDGGWLGSEVAPAGDVNGDGIDDIIIAADRFANSTGAAFVIYGQAGSSRGDVSIARLTPSEGFQILGASVGDRVSDVAGAGDINGDGYDDLIVGSSDVFSADGEQNGAAYVIFGRPSEDRGNIDLALLAHADGFLVAGGSFEEAMGYAVSSAGDINNDGYADLLFGAPIATIDGVRKGTNYVVYGRADFFVDANTSPAFAQDIDSVATLQNTRLDFTVAASDADGDRLFYQPYPAPEPPYYYIEDPSLTQHGSLQTGVGGVFRYTPDTGFIGVDLARILALDAQGGLALQTVLIQVEEAGNTSPTAPVSKAITAESGLTTSPVSIGASDADGDTLVFRVLDGFEPGKGTVDFGSSAFLYTAYDGALGADSFTILIEDGKGGYALQQVSVTIEIANEAPVAVDDTAQVNEDTVLEIAIASLLANDTDADGDSLILTSVAGAVNGQVAIAGPLVRFTPDADFNGTASFTYNVSDGHGGIDAAKVTITVNPVPDAPVATDDAFRADPDTAFVLTTGALLANDSDADGDGLSITALGTPAHGTVTLNGTSIVYQPDAGFTGTDSFTYTLSDGTGLTDTGHVSLDVRFNAAPELDAARSQYVLAGSSVSFESGATDADGDPLTFALTATPGHGTASVDASGFVTYTPAAGFGGSDAFTLTVSDGQGGTAIQDVTVTVVAVPAADQFRFITTPGYAGAIGGSGNVVGTAGFQDISVIDVAGHVTFDGSFNRGEDIVRLSGNAADWFIARSGSAALLVDGDTIVEIPAGRDGLALVFDDGARTLKIDSAINSLVIGDQAFGTTLVQITADPDGTTLPTGEVEDAGARLILAAGGTASLGGSADVVGTNIPEPVRLISGEIRLDGSFNRGGDTIILDDTADTFTARTVSSTVLLQNGDTLVEIPAGTVGLNLGFDDGADSRLLVIDNTVPGIFIGDQLLGADAVMLAAAV